MDVGVNEEPNAYTVPEDVPVLQPPKILLVPPPIVPIVAKVTDPPDVVCVTDDTDGEPVAPFALNVTVYSVTAAEVFTAVAFLTAEDVPSAFFAFTNK